MNVERKTDWQPEFQSRKNTNCMGGCNNWREFWRGIDYAGEACTRPDGFQGMDADGGQDRPAGTGAERLPNPEIPCQADRRKRGQKSVVIWLCKRRLMMPILSFLIVIFTVALAQAGVL